MRAVVQRVSRCSVWIDQKANASIEKGLLILLGIIPEDGMEDIQWLVKKIGQMRIFNDEKGVMNLSAIDVNAGIIVVSQFTLHASTRKGNRPSYIKAAKPEIAIPLYEKFVDDLSLFCGKEVGTGKFGADMKVDFVNDGPVTIIIDSKIKE
ncbi:MAG: D-tyrosyl-tRNA(Tyr) deacylase [Saprospiraceae bacterium]|nr:D-tyrosyl-tRNA(Tyr) deacylase [Saprospiraceae bacterium]